jgi:hypothetical protein
MSGIAKATDVLLERLTAGTTLLLAILLSLPKPTEQEALGLPDPATWTDGLDAEGRHVVLVGAHALRGMPEGEEAIRTVLTSLAEGIVPAGVHVVAYQPMASTALATIVVGEGVDEVMADGPRASGKTQMVPGAQAVLAELHARAGYPLPLRCLWLHDALVNATVKTARSLEAPMWGGLWTMENDRHTAALTVGGVRMVVADFVGTRDESAAERLRAESHIVCAEEVVPSLDESGGIEERKWELALTSARLTPNRRRIAVATTNPGGPDSDWYRRFIEGGGRPGCVRCQVPSSDRMTADEVERERERFRDSPDLEARLALGEWSALRLGQVVAAGLRPRGARGLGAVAAHAVARARHRLGRWAHAERGHRPAHQRAGADLRLAQRHEGGRARVDRGPGDPVARDVCPLDARAGRLPPLAARD